LGSVHGVVKLLPHLIVLVVLGVASYFVAYGAELYAVLWDIQYVKGSECCGIVTTHYYEWTRVGLFAGAIILFGLWLMWVFRTVKSD
jgi:hypothetical protein